MKIDASWLKTAMRMFVEEKKDYNYEEDSCSLVCGHYTQVIINKYYRPIGDYSFFSKLP